MGCLSFLCGGPTDLPRPDSTYSQLLSENTFIKGHDLDLDPSFGEHAIGELEQEEAWLTREPEAANNEPDAEPSVVIAHRGNTSIHKLLPRDRMRAGAERKVHIHEASSAPVEYWEDSPSSPPAPLVAPSSGVESYPLPETANRGRMPAPDEPSPDIESTDPSDEVDDAATDSDRSGLSSQPCRLMSVHLRDAPKSCQVLIRAVTPPTNGGETDKPKL
ncbi:hypothetical protein LXA43DRAFT_1100444 [Ganoderma leucocontextum]|nr:hypothetical protein LXA43DRAFT_1101299 [Ganoderma leucocontextum]KAI1785260.1 hypothetical protein LXA43DRAFT_1100444 [Ganoderma leucocontextum]